LAAALLTQSSTPATTVSAASYEAAVAPESIVAAFGNQLANQQVPAMDADPNTPGIQLPTELGGTTVEVNGRRAGLFYVSPDQVNYVIPANSELGTANVVVRSGSGTVSNGTVQVSAVAPALFTANNDGQGVPAAYLVRVKPNNDQVIEALSRLDPATNRFVAKPIDLGPEGERVFLVLYLSGIRQAPDPNGDGNRNETVRLVLGGREIIPDYVAPQGVFVGLDQLNVEIPRDLTGQGRVSLSVTAAGFASSNLAEVEIGSRPGNMPPQVSGFSSARVLAGEMMAISGQGFEANAGDNLVRVAGIKARVVTASPTQLTVQVPYGAETGPVSVRTPRGEGTSASVLSLRTPISSFIEDTKRRPLPGVSAKVLDTNITLRPTPKGSSSCRMSPLAPYAWWRWMRPGCPSPRLT
jgi:uncharacterized protein (TIGR03437 family)